MCGIAGLYSFAGSQPPQKPELASMISTLDHRGPDGSSTFVDGPVGLAHARLSIIDLATGWQPIANEDNSIWVVFNGEIFNFIELRRDLERRGHQFRTHSDTEVIVHLYEDLGLDFVDRLNGQFAIALWDKARNRLILARDRAGIRPIYYTQARGRLAFASEVKALFVLPDVPRKLDIEGLASTFSFWSVLPPKTVFDGICSLPPGHRMVVEESGIRVERYWDWSFPEEISADRPEEECAEELRVLLIDAVRLQLRADVPVGAYLSGGLDSSIITTIIKNHTNTPLRSFSLTFENPEFDERTHQLELVRHLNTEHSEHFCRSGDIGAAFPRAVWHAEAPLVRTAPTPMMLLAGSVRAAGYKVVLTGEGADEVFGGYDLFKEAKVRRFLARAPDSKWRGRLLERLYPYLQHSPATGRAFAQRFFSEGLDQLGEPWFAHIPRMTTTRRALQFLQPDLQAKAFGWDPKVALRATLPDGIDRWPPLCRDQYVEASTLMSGYLLSSQGDRMAMAASIEARFPFLDHRVIEFANRLPPQYKLRVLSEKHILKKALASELPQSISRRSKQPYRSPDSSSFFNERRTLDWVADVLSPTSVKNAGIFDAGAVGKLLEKCRTGRALGFGDNMSFVGILSTMLLHAQFIAPASGPRSFGTA